MRLVTLDIETRPPVVYAWGLFDQNIGVNQIIDRGGVFCFAAKEYGRKKVEYYADWTCGHKEMVKAAYEILDQCDAVIHWNGITFDVPHLNREFLLTLEKYPSPYKQIDLLQTARKKFRFISNKLENVAQEVLGEGKDKTDFDLWKECLDGNKEAQRRMEKYNKRDVRLTERLYDVFLPIIANHPSFGAFTGKSVCPNCGSDEYVRRGSAYTAQTRYPRFHCKGCGKYFRGTAVLDRVHIAQIAGA